MTPQSWKGAADWAEQLHGDYSTQIERRDLMEEENSKTRELVSQLKRANALLSGEEKPKEGGALKLLSTGGGGGGLGGVSPMGRLPGFGDGGTRGGGTTTDGRPAGPFPAGTHGGPGGPPITPTAPGGTVPATLPGAQAPLGYPVGTGFTPVQDLTTYTGQPAAGAGGAPGAGGNVPLPGGTGSSAIYNKLLAAYQNSSVVGTIPKDGERYGFKTGSAEEWARYGMMVAAAESDYNPKTAVSNAKEQSFGIFQYNHPQVPGGNAFDVDASVKAFVRDSESSMKSHGGFGPGSILYQRFSTVQNPRKTLARAGQADAAIAAARRDGRQPTAQPPSAASPSNLTILKTRPVEPGQVPTLPGGATPALPREALAPQPMLPVQPGRPAQPAGGLPPAPITGTVWEGLGAPRGAYGGLKAHRHAGVDIGAPEGTPVLAMKDGVVVKNEFQRGATGGIVTIRYADGTEAKYMHLSNWEQPGIKPGAPVKAGQVIGLSGYSPAARSSGAHLHHELRDKQGNLIDPLEYYGWGSSSRGAESARGVKVFAGQSYGAQGQVAGPGVPTGATPTPNIQTLKTRPVAPTLDFTGGDLLKTPSIVPNLPVETDEERTARRARATAHMPGVDREEMDRKVIDAIAGRRMRARSMGNANIDVNVKSEGQKSVSQVGPFRKVRLSRATQMEHASSGPDSSSEGGAGGGGGSGANAEE
jgi:murein DD-endopeptidase MepM/ murein hydrolase activator NlpD